MKIFLNFFLFKLKSNIYILFGGENMKQGATKLVENL
jgi:hypothetical protein